MKCFMSNQECIHETDLRQHYDKKCLDDPTDDRINRLFVISPFGYPYDDLYREAIVQLDPQQRIDNSESVESPSKLADAKCESEVKVVRADRAVQLGFVMCQKICKEIRKADLILVDLSEPNPNVYYELGLAFGFGKKIIFLIGDTIDKNQRYLRPWMRFIENQDGSYLGYQHLHDLSSDNPRYEAIMDLFKENMFDSNKLTKSFRDPLSYIENVEGKRGFNKQVLFCVSTPIHDKKMLLNNAKRAITAFGWELCQYDLNYPFTVGQLLNVLKHCKVCMIDISHYSNSINPYTYWVLGLSHALGRDSIPITNRAKSGDDTPFDIRGLYQIYYESLDSFRDSLRNIMEVIDTEYQEEKSNYPTKYVWDKLLQPYYELEVITFGRGSVDPSRDGGRTNVDRWDYQAVTKLASFLAQKYKDVNVIIKDPEDKRVIENNDFNLREEEIREKINNLKNFIIVGSPDVSDHAEVILSAVYGVEAYTPKPCDNPICKGSLCPNNCPGKHGYIFIKMSSYDGTSGKNPRDMSFSYRKAASKDKQGVLWYGKMHPCQDDITYGVISILYENPFYMSQIQKNGRQSYSSIVILSGFTGVATYGLAVLLSGDDSYQANELKRHIRKYENNDAVQILVKIEYSNNDDNSTHETRRFRNVQVEDVRPLRRIADYAIEGT